MFTKHLHNFFICCQHAYSSAGHIHHKTGPKVIFMLARLLRTALIMMIYGLGFFSGTFGLVIVSTRCCSAFLNSSLVAAREQINHEAATPAARCAMDGVTPAAFT